jgi:competence protein ComQ
MIALVEESMPPGYQSCRREISALIEYKMSSPSLWSELMKQTGLLFGGNSAQLIRLCAVGELIVLALDIIDDLQDRDNPDMPWLQYPVKDMLHAAQLMLHSSLSGLQQMAVCKPAAATVAERITAFLLRAFNGQFRDITDKMQSETDYFQIIEEKSASLVIICSLLGYLSTDSYSPSEMNALIELSSYLGISAQMDNDLRDVVRFDIKSDLLQRKKTLPVIYLLMKAQNQFPLLTDYFDSRISQEYLLEHKDELAAFIASSRCHTYTKLIQQLYLQKLKVLLEQLVPDPEARKRFESVTIQPLMR